MSTIVRNVRDIEASDRVALEHVIGEELREDQQVIIQVVASSDVDGESKPRLNGRQIPEWWNVYEGLKDEEVERIHKSIVRTPGCREVEL